MGISDVTYRHFVMLEEGLPELKLVCLKAEDDDGYAEGICFSRDDGVNLSIAMPHRLSTLLSSMAGDAVSEVRASPQPQDQSA
ncbi:hypothetical protein FOQG_09233 [Fusarium oxysporum f. sp. raphani 54005]|uniref:Uncharacterized protein n=5 Tax=Fusarium oxysporum TaxID=5507 RepID=X0C8A3_FUSOX|nr:hypothetical protein FOVG_08685 [Fusarium oxysporum f. sp. pisi HDV247]EXK87433.1 hypothetical protein FOQG_09233 [Fusarium oxysporum f. sp. raphani 54005]EXL81157.1 hypothetical protein FOPG_05508 [Fusarium oxysporum f. sp. conglutinans race 2 54008]EXM33432.1 hypothetical protein FOTG_02088 [Fusarium oxysporum f. sp. vasinfectum 25433]